MTGFPFPPGSARVWRVTSDGEAEVYAEGFTNILGVDFDSQGNLYVLEMVAGGLLNANPEDPSTVAGALYRVESDGSHTLISGSELVASTGLAIASDNGIVVYYPALQ